MTVFSPQTRLQNIPSFPEMTSLLLLVQMVSLSGLLLGSRCTRMPRTDLSMQRWGSPFIYMEYGRDSTRIPVTMVCRKGQHFTVATGRHMTPVNPNVTACLLDEYMGHVCDLILLGQKARWILYPSVRQTELCPCFSAACYFPCSMYHRLFLNSTNMYPLQHLSTNVWKMFAKWSAEISARA